MTGRRLILPLLIAGLIGSASANAADIPAAYRLAAARHGIPVELFFAVALTESGRDLGAQRIPWPWTLNIHGEGRYFADRASAWRTAVAAIAAKRTSVDFGPMQVNWRYHHRQLVDPWRALDPNRNLRIGATILIRCKKRVGTWWGAVGCYHAPSNEIRARRYRQRVLTVWRSLVRQ